MSIGPRRLGSSEASGLCGTAWDARYGALPQPDLPVMIGITGKRIVRGPALVLQVRKDMLTGYRLRLRTEQCDSLSDSLFVMPKKPVA